MKAPLLAVAALLLAGTAQGQMTAASLAAAAAPGSSAGLAASQPRAVVTGATSGLGQALAVQLGAQGWKVAVIGRRQEMLQNTARMVELAGGTALALTGDVTDAETVRSNYAAIKEQWGGVDLAILNAGVPSPMDARKFSAAEVHRVMNTNVGGAANWMEAVLPGMLEQKSGKIAGIASLAGYRGLPIAGPYSASKAALANLLEASRIDLKGTGVDVITVNPGFIRTEITKGQDNLPFMLDAEDAANRILKGIARGDRVISFPGQLAWPMRLLVKNMPNAIYDWIGRMMAEQRRKNK